MSVSDSFVSQVTELLSHWGATTPRKMFGGVGFFHQEVMFALAVDDTLYLRTDPASVAAFEERGLAEYTYQGVGRERRMPYHQAPAEALDDAQVMSDWAAGAFRAAMRAKGS